MGERALMPHEDLIADLILPDNRTEFASKTNAEDAITEEPVFRNNSAQDSTDEETAMGSLNSGGDSVADADQLETRAVKVVRGRRGKKIPTVSNLPSVPPTGKIIHGRAPVEVKKKLPPPLPPSDSGLYGRAIEELGRMIDKRTTAVEEFTKVVVEQGKDPKVVRGTVRQVDQKDDRGLHKKVSGNAALPPDKGKRADDTNIEGRVLVTGQEPEKVVAARRDKYQTSKLKVWKKQVEAAVHASEAEETVENSSLGASNKVDGANEETTEESMFDRVLKRFRLKK